MTLSTQRPLRANTPRLSRISGARRNASKSDSITKQTIGTSTFHMLALTRPKIELPRSSQPDTQAACFGNAAWICARSAIKVEESDSGFGFNMPRVKRFVSVRAEILLKIQLLIGLVGQKGV